jgi:lipopolysaccharide export LptBFGC system permease protein LptF
MEEKPKIKWYFKTHWLVIAFLCFGPLALPLIWFHPRYRPITKVVITIVIILLTYYSSVVLSKYLQSLSGYYQGIF